MNITPIIDLPIEDVISKYVTLKRKGTSLTACCPFHAEKTGSFHVSKSKNMFKCFGCGAGGNAINFVMKYETLNFVDACKKIAHDRNLKIDLKPETEEDKQAEDKRETLFVIMDISRKWFNEQLYAAENALALEYALTRWTKKQIDEENIGFAPNDWQAFLNYAKTQSISEQNLIDAGLCAKSEEKNRVYDVFRNRIMFPITNRYGRTISYSGRILPGSDDKQPKYINGKDTVLYNKSKTLYGLNTAARSIDKKNFAFLVEGNADVLKLQLLNRTNVVAPCGTSLTKEQIFEIKKLCNSITIIGDGDEAGLKAMIENGRKIIEQGMFCNVLPLPVDGEKTDPDSFFTSEAQCKEYAKNNYQDFILWMAENEKDKCKTPDYKARVIKDLTPLIAKLDVSVHSLIIDKISLIIKPKKAWTDELKLILKEEVKVEKKEYIPEHVKLSDFEHFGFYDDNNCYYFKTSKGIIQGSNFILKPLFHIESITASKRLYEITNEYGYRKLIELDQKNLISLPGFQLCVESLGNFIWMGGSGELNKLKSFLYEETLTAKMIDQMGWHKEGFFVWANGIYNSQFTTVDDLGIVSHNEQHYYIPANSKIYDSEEKLFMAEKKFKYVAGNITMNNYTHKLSEVFGDNATIAFCYLLASLNRDIIVNEFGFFPMLNLFGFPGSGKTELGESLLHFFGPEQKGINLPSITEPAMADYVAQNQNAIALLDEYRNDFEPSKNELLKGLWKSIGRNRMMMDKDKKKEETKVEQGIIICGQQMPTVDNALFKRLLYLTFYKCEYTAEEKQNFIDFKTIEKQGLGHLTHEILSHRQFFKDNFITCYNKVSDDLREALGDIIIEDRIFRNWLVAIASFLTLKDKINTSFNYIDLCTLAIEGIKIQNAEAKTSNEIATFWRIIQYLDSDGLIHEGADYKIKLTNELKTDTSSYDFPEDTNVLFIQQSRIIPLYRKIGRSMGESVLLSDSIDYYLRNDNRFLGRKSSESFHQCDPKTGQRLQDSSGNKLRKVNSAYCFLYDKLNITLSENNKNDEDFEKPF